MIKRPVRTCSVPVPRGVRGCERGCEIASLPRQKSEKVGFSQRELLGHLVFIQHYHNYKHYMYPLSVRGFGVFLGFSRGTNHISHPPNRVGTPFRTGQEQVRTGPSFSRILCKETYN